MNERIDRALPTLVAAMAGMLSTVLLGSLFDRQARRDLPGIARSIAATSG